MSSSLDARVAQLEADLAELKVVRDRQQIYDRFMLYTRGVDRCDPAIVAEVYPGCPAAGILKWVLARTKVAMHFVGNCLSTVDGDDAESEAYFISYHLVARDTTDYLRCRGARYFMSWRRAETGWIIVEREVVDEWSIVQEIAERAEDNETWIKLHGRRSTEDASYDIRKFLENT